MRIVLAAVAAAAVSAVVAPLAAAQPVGAAKPVPSLTPKATQRLWEHEVKQALTRRSVATAGCRPVRLVFYAESDWLRLATKLAANPSPCAQYYISIPPLAADKTKFRYDQPWRIRALGPQFHVLAEINYNGWTNWVTANNSTYYDAGVEARKRMDANGFDVASGDSWVVNEFSSAVRNGTNVARQKVRDLVRGLYTGDGTQPQLKGAVFDIGIGQSTADLSSYQLALQSWYGDSAFWGDMSAYVSDWSQELYGDVRDYAVPGSTVADRVAHLNDFLQHQLLLADAAPSADAGARSFLDAAYSPLANAAWVWDSGFGYTDVSLDQMEDYVSAQVDALRTFDLSRGAQDRFGFAWAPEMPGNAAWTPDFTTQTGQLLDRLAAAIHDSAVSPDAACAGTCTTSLTGAQFVEGWKQLASWPYPALGITTGAQTLVAGAASQPLTVQLQQAGVAQTATTPVSVGFSSSSAGGAFATSADGPWTSTLSVAVPVGASSASVYYRDTAAGSPTVTASAVGWGPATQVETVQAGAPASLAVSPASATVALGSTATFTATGADAYGNAVPPSGVTWTATGGTLSTAAGPSTVFTPAAAGTATITASSSGLTATGAVTVTGKQAHVSSISFSRSGSTLTVAIASNVARATVGIRVLRGSSTVTTAGVATGFSGTATLKLRNAARGCYSATITSVAASGYAWDGTTPTNGSCF